MNDEVIIAAGLVFAITVGIILVVRLIEAKSSCYFESMINNLDARTKILNDISINTVSKINELVRAVNELEDSKEIKKVKDDKAND